VLRKLNYNVINIGKTGNGSLIQLATLKEYAEPLQPKIVLWLYYENDLSDLRKEMHFSSFLRQYLNEDDFSQNLISRQDEIDRVLINFTQDELKKRNNKKDKEVKKKINVNWLNLSNQEHLYFIIYRILKLSNFRIKFYLYPKYYIPLIEFKKILEKSNKMVSSWNGKLYFVYLPSYYKYSYATFNPLKKFATRYYTLDLEHYDDVLRTASELDIPIIDMHKEVFEPHSDPLSLFPFRKWGHYTANGYYLVAETISKRLKNDGFIPLELNN
jgi:hypothetical protein